MTAGTEGASPDAIHPVPAAPKGTEALRDYIGRLDIRVSGLRALDPGNRFDAYGSMAKADAYETVIRELAALSGDLGGRPRYSCVTCGYAQSETPCVHVAGGVAETAPADAGAERVMEPLTDYAKLRGVLAYTLSYARSGWRPDGGLFYCLVCDAQLTVAVKSGGTRAPTFDAITHDPDCPVPDIIAILASASPEAKPTPAESSNVGALDRRGPLRRRTAQGQRTEGGR